MSRASTGTYHHGDLRNALLAAAAERVAAKGPQRLVLRELLRDVGVSHSAAYRHFASLGELMTALRAHSQEKLADSMSSALDDLPDIDDAALLAVVRMRTVGEQYIRFALAESGLFRAAFFTDADADADVSTVEPTGDDASQVLAGPLAEGHLAIHVPLVVHSPPYRILSACVADLAAAGVIAQERRAEVEVGAWSAVHGISMLLLDGPLSTVDPAARQDLIEYALSIVAKSF